MAVPQFVKKVSAHFGHLGESGPGASTVEEDIFRSVFKEPEAPSAAASRRLGHTQGAPHGTPRDIDDMILREVMR